MSTRAPKTETVMVDGKEIVLRAGKLKIKDGEIQPLTERQAQELTAKIFARLDECWEWIKAAYLGRAHVAMGYESWDEYCKAEFQGAHLRLPKEKRREAVASLTDAGLSTRAIASATGISEGTVRNDLKDSGAQNYAGDKKIQGIDGKEYSKPKPKPTGAVVTPILTPPAPEPEIIDAEVVDEMPAIAAAPEPPKKDQRRSSIMDTADQLGWDARKLGDRLKKLRCDDRFTSNKSEIAVIIRGHLEHLESQLFDLMFKLPHTKTDEAAS